jgi:hypothetical protein
MLPVPGFPFPSAEEFPAGFLSKDWEDFFSLRPVDRLGVPELEITESMQDSFLKEVFAVP